MNNKLYTLLLFFVAILLFSCKSNNKTTINEQYAGSESCIECHQKFYDVWEPSFHAKAIRPINKLLFQQTNLTSSESFTIEGNNYQMVMEDSTLTMIEEDGSAEKKHNIVWALGGKNILYFLTPLEGGKLQTIPLAFDVSKKEWYNNPASAIRHFSENMVDEPLSWKDRMYTFNSSCYSCHVSQLSTNYDLETDSYHTNWRESGINCETCHGPSAEHVRVCKIAQQNGNKPEDLKIIITSTFMPEQHNSSCAPCHAKMEPITASYTPGDRFFDNYNLITLENADFYPDGRDLGENYTYTSWKQNACLQSSDLNCITCHTSSGYNRFEKNPNNACINCHSEKARDLTAHTGHKEDSEGSLCVNCHMPKTEFGRMVRSDHSFRPPMPAATIEYGSPNACNNCHTAQSPQWANAIVKERENSNYQDSTLYWAKLIESLRKNEWQHLDEILELIEQNEYNEVVIASMIRLLAGNSNEKIIKSLISALKNNPSPLVRSSAASTLHNLHTKEIRDALADATSDSIRLVRISAANSLANYEINDLNNQQKEAIDKATEEYLNALTSRQDNWGAHYNLGLFHQREGNNEKALQSYETAARIYPESILPLINSSILYSYIGDDVKAKDNLEKVLKIDSNNEAANLNLGLLMAEKGDLSEAKKYLKAALNSNPQQAVAAYNLSVILVKESNLEQAIVYVKQAAEANKEAPKYVYTLAFYQYENSQTAEAEKTLKNLLKLHPLYIDAIHFLHRIYMDTNREDEAEKLIEKALENENISNEQKYTLEQLLTRSI